MILLFSCDTGHLSITNTGITICCVPSIQTSLAEILSRMFPSPGNPPGLKLGSNRAQLSSRIMLSLGSCGGDLGAVLKQEGPRGKVVYTWQARAGHESSPQPWKDHCYSCMAPSPIYRHIWWHPIYSKSHLNSTFALLLRLRMLW